MHPSRSILAALFVFGFLAYFIPQVFIEHFPPVRTLFTTVFLVGMPIYILYFRNDLTILTMLTIIFLCVTLMVMSGLLGIGEPIRNATTMYFYFSIILGFFFATNYELFFKLIKILLLINTLALFYEFATSSYILAPTSDAIAFYGRAKGLISYSKEAGAFVLVATVVFSHKLEYKWFPILGVSAVLSGSRMAMIFVAAVLLVELISRAIISKKDRNKILMVLCASILFTTFYASLDRSQIIINRLRGAFDTNHSSNLERISYWLDYLHSYAGYDLSGLLFGRPGKTQFIVGNGAESTFLTLLTDGGLLAFLIYLSALSIIVIKSNNWVAMLAKVSVLMITMQISRVAIGFLDGTIFWFLFWITVFGKQSGGVDEHRYKTKGGNHLSGNSGVAGSSI